MKYVIAAFVACAGVVITAMFASWLNGTIVSAFDNHDVGLLVAVCADIVIVPMGFMASIAVAAGIASV